MFSVYSVQNEIVTNTMTIELLSIQNRFNMVEIKRTSKIEKKKEMYLNGDRFYVCTANSKTVDVDRSKMLNCFSKKRKKNLFFHIYYSSLLSVILRT